MAVGDVVNGFLAAAGASRQPSVGVEEEISLGVMGGTTDAFELDNASVSVDMTKGLAGTVADLTTRNMTLRISNTNFLTKGGTTDVGAFGGVQTNA